MTNRRRMIIIIVSVFFGTLLSGVLVWSRTDKMNFTDYTTLGFNMFLAVALVFGMVVILGKHKKE